jgi:hypothetical protein
MKIILKSYITVLIGMFVLLCFPLSLKGQTQEVRARMIDKAKGQPIPWVYLYVNGKLKCISNVDGDVLTETDASDTLLLKAVGYVEQKLPACQLPAVVEMEPLVQKLREVVVMSDIAVLMNAFKKLKLEYKEHEKETNAYFNRILLKSGDQTEVVESYLSARSAVNIRRLGLYAGQYWGKTEMGDSVQSSLEHTDLHRMLGFGPMMTSGSYMDGLTLPFPKRCSPSYLKRFYEISSKIMEYGGKLVYLIHLDKKEAGQTELLAGDMYIDSESFQLLRFDGSMDMQLLVKRGRGSIIKYEQVSGSFKIHINYRNIHGYTEVSDMYYEFVAGELNIKSVLLNVEDHQFPLKDPVPIRANILAAINKVQSPYELFEEQNLIKRTADEEAAIQRLSTGMGQSDESRFLPIKKYLQRAMGFSRVVPQEKVYLHFDNTGYFENETMWFKAYVTRTDNGKPSDLSKVLYVELLNPSGDVIKTQKFPIDSQGMSHGDMKLDTLLGSGFYEVRAYTRYMTNWGVNAVFSRVFPVFKKPQQEGDYTDLTIRTMLYRHRDPNNRDRSDSLYLRAIDEGISTNDLMKTISVRFYPEGGSLVRGKKCRVAMLAVDDNGNPYSGEGFVLNEAGDVLASVQTDTLGRGLFEVTPDDSPLTFQMRNLRQSDRRAFQNFSLPEARTEGCALLLDAVSDSMSVTLQCTPAICGNLLGYVVMHNGNITYCDTVTASPCIGFSLDRQNQKDGVSQLTVFDSKGEILAERLFFIIPEKRAEDSIRVSAGTQRLKPCGRVELELQALPNAHLSFSAMDAQTMTNGSRGNMQTWMLLSSEVRGYIHNVDYYFEADDAEHRRSADLLMLTQGWRRYDWEVMTGQKGLEKVQPIEDKFYIFGKLKAYRQRNAVDDVNLRLFLYNQEGQSLTGKTVTDSLGNYAFELPFVDGEWTMQIYTRKKTEKGKEKLKTYYVGIDRQFSPRARYITPQEAKILHPLDANAFVKKPFEELPDGEEFIPITKKDHVLENVTVKAKRRYFTNDDWQYKNEAWGRQFATLHYDIDKELDAILDRGEPEPTIFYFLCKKNALFDNPECEDLPRPAGGESHQGLVPVDGRMSYAHRPIKWIVDNGLTHTAFDEEELDAAQAVWHKGMDDNYAGYTNDTEAKLEVLFPFYMSEIKSLYIVPNSEREVEGAVRIYLYTHKTFSSESQKGLRRTYFQGFNKPSTFQMEDYSVIPPMADFRRTIYWNPNVKTDAQGKAKVEFFNNSTCEEMYISVEGMTEDGKVLVNE